MGQPNKLGFVGVNSMDICIYLGSIFCNLNLEILILDFSKEQLMQYGIPYPQGEITTVHYQGIDYGKLEFFEWKHLEQKYMDENTIYDYVFFFFGKEWSLCMEFELAETIFVTDCQHQEIIAYEEILKQIQIPSTVIMRSVLEQSWLKRNILQSLKAHCFVVESYVVPYDEFDERYRVLMQYEPYTQFLQISKAMETTLIDITRATLPCSKKKALDAWKGVKKGAYI